MAVFLNHNCSAKTKQARDILMKDREKTT